MNYRYYEQGACFYLNDLGSIFTVRVNGGSLVYYSKDTRLVAPVRQLIESYTESLEFIDKNNLDVVLNEITQKEIKLHISEYLKGKAPLEADCKLAKALKLQGKVGFSINRKASVSAKDKLKRLRKGDQNTLLDQYAALDANHVRFDDMYMKGRISVIGRTDTPNAILMGIRATGIRDIVRKPDMDSDIELSYPDKKLAIIVFRLRLDSNGSKEVLRLIDSKLKSLIRRRQSLDASGYSYIPVWVFESDDCEIVELESCFANILQYIRAVNSLKVEYGCNVELTYGYKHTAFIALQTAKSFFERKNVQSVFDSESYSGLEEANSLKYSDAQEGFLKTFLLHVCRFEKSVTSRMIKNGFTIRSASTQSMNQLKEAYELDNREAAIIYTALNSKR